MEGLLSLYHPVVVEDKWNERVVRQYLGACRSHQTFSRTSCANLQPVVGSINAFLSVQSTRFHGLLVLQAVVGQCSTQVFEENVIGWMQHCIKAMQEKGDSFSLAADVLCQLLESSSQFPEFTKKISSTIIAPAISHIANAPTQGLHAALRLLLISMEKYRGPCVQSKAQIVKLLLLMLDREEESVIALASDCFSLLPQIGGGGNLGETYKAEWKSCTESFLGSLHETLNQLYEDVNLMQSSENIKTRLPLPAVSGKSPVEKLVQLKIRFVNLCQCLEALLRNPFPVAKAVPVGAIFDLICRSLDVNCKTLGSRLVEALTIGAVLPQIHTAVLCLLDGLIACCEANLYPQALLINKLVLVTLKWTSPDARTYGVSQPYESLRCTAYRVLQSWLQVSRAGSLVESFAKDLVSEAISDCKPLKASAVRLHTTLKTSRKRKKHQQPQPEEQTWHRKVNLTANEEVCSEALKALQCLLYSGGSSMKAVSHQELHQMALGILLELQRGPEPLPIPYSSVVCRHELYKLLLALVLNPHPKWPPPLHMAASVFSRGLQDPALEVAKACTLAMAVTEKIIHPVAQTMHFSLTMHDVEDKEEEDVEQEEEEEVVMVGSKRKGEEQREKGEEESKSQKVNGCEPVVSTIDVEDDRHSEPEREVTTVNGNPEVISIGSSGEDSDGSVQEAQITNGYAGTKRKIKDVDQPEGVSERKKVPPGEPEAPLGPTLEEMLATFVDVEDINGP